MKSCAYCDNFFSVKGHEKTDEHIFPASLIKMFPEQDISFHNNKKYVDNRGMTISDVCAYCNNIILSELDAYGKEIIEKYFYIPYKFNDYFLPFQIEMDTVKFTRWILKIIYNDIRLDKHSTQYIKKYIPYIMGDSTIIPNGLTLLMGIHVNLNPVTEEFFAYKPLQICPAPQFFYNSYIRVESGEPMKRLIFKGAGQTFSIRIANCILYIILWKPTVNTKNIQSAIMTLQEDFRFRLLSPTLNKYSVRSVSSPTNAIVANYAHFYSEIAVQEILSIIKSSLQGRDIGKCNEEFSQLWSPGMTRSGRALVEAAEFPNNKKKQKALSDLFDKD